MNAPDTSGRSIPIDLPTNLQMWGLEQVKRDFQSEKTEFQLPDEYISGLYDEYASGVDFPELTSEDLVTLQVPSGCGKTI